MDIKTAVIIGVALVAAGIANSGIYSVTAGGASNPTGGSVYIVNRFSGYARICVATFCRPIQETGPTAPPFDPTQPYTTVPPSK